MHAPYLYELSGVTRVTQHTPAFFERYTVMFGDRVSGTFVFVPSKIFGRLMAFTERVHPVVYIAVPRNDVELLRYRLRTGAAFVQHWVHHN